MEPDKVPEPSPHNWQSIEEWGENVEKERLRKARLRTSSSGSERFDRVLQSNLLFEIATQLAAIRSALEQIASWRG